MLLARTPTLNVNRTAQRAQRQHDRPEQTVDLTWYAFLQRNKLFSSIILPALQDLDLLLRRELVLVEHVLDSGKD